MKQALAKAGSKGENPVNSMDQEEADMAKVGRRKSKEAADEFLDSSKCRLKKKDIKRKSGGNDVEMKGGMKDKRSVATVEPEPEKKEKQIGCKRVQHKRTNCLQNQVIP